MVDVVSLFSGCGGSSMGYRMAGCEVKLACDFERLATQIYARNFPDTPVLRKDVRKVTGDEISRISGVDEVDILDGSPPCGSFSTSGIREKGWGRKYVHNSESKSQRSDDLFFEYIRILKELKPRAFVAENVKGLMLGVARGYFNEILRKMKGSGYVVEAYCLNAADYGVPQTRERVIFVGFRKDVKIDGMARFTKQRRMSFLEAVSGLQIPNAELKASKAMFFASSRYSFLRLTRQGQQVSKVHPKRNNFNCSRAKLDKPVPTITAHGNMLIHPTESRWLTTSELKRCSSFPDHFWFPENTSAHMRIGNAVPPKLIKAVAEYAIGKGRLAKYVGLPKPEDRPAMAS